MSFHGSVVDIVSSVSFCAVRGVHDAGVFDQVSLLDEALSDSSVAQHVAKVCRELPVGRYVARHVLGKGVGT